MEAKRIACLGDSITYGHGVAQTRELDAWPFVLQRMLGGGIEVLNFGQNGATAIEGTPDSYADCAACRAALESGADCFILMLGTNDTKKRYWNKERYAEGLEKLINAVLARASRLILMLPPKAFPGPDGIAAYDVCSSTLLLEVIPEIRLAAKRHGLELIDLCTLTENHPEYYLEGVHPNREGNRAIAERVYRQFQPGKNITVYLGASQGKDPKLKEAAAELGSWIGRSGNRLVYGGSKSGLMGVLAESVIAAGGKVTGVEPRFFVDMGLVYDDIEELIITENMADRRAKMMELGDAFIAFPGGTGTLEEIAEVMSRVYLGHLDAPCILYDLNGYYEGLRTQLSTMAEKGLSGREDQKKIHFAESLAEIADIIG